MIFKTIQPPSQFGGAPSATSVLQYDIKPSIDATGKYAVAFVKEQNEIDYFEVPNNKENGIWINGLDDKASASECLALYDDKEQAINSLQIKGHGFKKQGFYKGRIYETVYHENDSSLELKLIDEFTE